MRDYELCKGHFCVLKCLWRRLNSITLDSTNTKRNMNLMWDVQTLFTLTCCALACYWRYCTDVDIFVSTSFCWKKHDDRKLRPSHDAAPPSQGGRPVLFPGRTYHYLMETLSWSWWRLPPAHSRPWRFSPPHLRGLPCPSGTTSTPTFELARPAGSRSCGQYLVHKLPPIPGDTDLFPQGDDGRFQFLDGGDNVNRDRYPPGASTACPHCHSPLT